MRTSFAFTFSLIVLTPSLCFAGGFEIPENTALSVAREGTGVVSRRDPAALYFNPALLPRADGLQVLLDSNFVNLNLDFQRNPLEVNGSTQEFTPASNDSGFFPAPFFAASYDFGIDDLGVGIGVFGPSAYGKRCLTRIENGECQPDPQNSARHMMVESDIIEVFFTLGVGYDFHILGGTLSVGASGALAYQNTSFTVVVDELLGADGTWDENPDFQAPLKSSGLTDIQPTGMFGVNYANQGFRVGASYRPPIAWETVGAFELDLPPDLEEAAKLENATMTFKINQAGSLRAGVGYEHGTHPGFSDRPLFDIEFNYVWEDWSRVEAFEIIPEADFTVFDQPQPLNPVYQPRNWTDTHSFRLGGSYGAMRWLTIHGGGAYETAANPEAYTNVDFVSWDRINVGAGASFHALKWLDVEIAYGHTFSEDRTVTDGKIYQPIPLSGCTGPDFDSDACANTGVPPGNPQNEGTWSSSFQIISVGVTGRWDL